jgi:hypothetical protein
MGLMLLLVPSLGRISFQRERPVPKLDPGCHPVATPSLTDADGRIAKRDNHLGPKSTLANRWRLSKPPRMTIPRLSFQRQSAVPNDCHPVATPKLTKNEEITDCRSNENEMQKEKGIQRLVPNLDPGCHPVATPSLTNADGCRGIVGTIQVTGLAVPKSSVSEDLHNFISSHSQSEADVGVQIA